jgi:hypothetical protein
MELVSPTNLPRLSDKIIFKFAKALARLATSLKAIEVTLITPSS